MAGKRRKVDDEGRTFQSAWTEKYFFVKHYSKPACLICQTSFAVMKDFNVIRHYETCHSKYKEYVGESRKIKNLKSGFEQQTIFFRKNKKKANQLLRQHWLLVRSSLNESNHFTDAKFIKECT